MSSDDIALILLHAEHTASCLRSTQRRRSRQHGK